MMAACMLLLLAWAAAALFPGEAQAHESPHLTFTARFQDEEGKPVSNLSALVEWEGARGEAEIVDGEARIKVAVIGPVPAQGRLRVVDIRRRPVAIKSRDGILDSATFPLSVRVGPEGSFPFGMPALLHQDTSHVMALSQKAWVLLYAPARRDPDLARELAEAAAIDAGNEALLRRRLAEMMEKGWKP